MIDLIFITGFLGFFLCSFLFSFWCVGLCVHMCTWISSPVSCLCGDQRQHPVFLSTSTLSIRGGMLIGVGVCICACWLTCLHMWRRGYTGIFPQSLSTFHFLRKSPSGNLKPIDSSRLPKRPMSFRDA